MKLDPQQLEVTRHFFLLTREIQRSQDHVGPVKRMLRFITRDNGIPKGLYVWGGVGRGKTMLMDEFFENLATPRKQRSHFHGFMRDVHAGLKKNSGQPDPLREVAEQLAREVRVLCLDEFFVSDIGDAMILGELLRWLVEFRVVLVATSNIEPNRLYENGLQRRRFLPAIELIETRMRVVFLGGETDYRLKALQDRDLYRIGTHADKELLDNDIEELIGPSRLYNSSLRVNERTIATLFRSDGVVAFQFQEICGGPRSALDYIEIARTHHTVAIYDIPEMNSQLDNSARRFISLIDVLYDRNVNLVLHAAQPVLELYSGERHQLEFERTRSRIAEMSSTAYLSKPHLA